jgi:hypothetical protein
MANPTGHTYHFARHNPNKEEGGPGVAYRETPLETGGSVQQPIQRFALKRGLLNNTWGRLSSVVESYPLTVTLSGLALSYLAARYLLPRRR